MTDKATEGFSSDAAVGAGGVEHAFGVLQVGQTSGVTKSPVGPHVKGKVAPRVVTWPAVEHW